MILYSKYFTVVKKLRLSKKFCKPSRGRNLSLFFQSDSSLTSVKKKFSRHQKCQAAKTFKTYFLCANKLCKRTFKKYKRLTQAVIDCRQNLTDRADSEFRSETNKGKQSKLLLGTNIVIQFV